MQPVVNGLLSKNANEIALQEINAGFGVGAEVFNFYALPGHPSYIIRDPSGNVLWKGIGVMSEADLQLAISASLQSYQGQQDD